MDEYFSYRKLRVYQQAKELVIYVYGLLLLFPKEEQYALCDQLRRAVISIPSNIAEGMGRGVCESYEGKPGVAEQQGR